MTEVVHIRAGRRRAIPAAIGIGHIVRGRALAGRLLLLFVVAGLAAGALGLKVADRANPESLPPLTGAARVTPHVLRAGQPADFELVQLRDAYHVRAVVNLRFAADAEGDIAASFGLDYLWLPLATGAAPTAADLDSLVSFVRRYDSGSDVVLVHDDVGGGRAITAGLMLLMLRGGSMDAVMSTLSAEERQLLSAQQSSALATLHEALTGQGDLTGNGYREAVTLRW